jgi:hypothetical protein
MDTDDTRVRSPGSMRSTGGWPAMSKVGLNQPSVASSSVISRRTRRSARRSARSSSSGSRNCSERACAFSMSSTGSGSPGASMVRRP